jgi:hypothetical protein
VERYFCFLKVSQTKEMDGFDTTIKEKNFKERTIKDSKSNKRSNKILRKKKTAFVGSIFDYLYLFITNCSIIEQIVYSEHFCDIIRNKYKEFYDKYQQKLCDIRNLLHTTDCHKLT